MGPNPSMTVPSQPVMAGNPSVMHTPTTPSASAPPPGQVSQSNLNQIVSFGCFCLLWILSSGIQSGIYSRFWIHADLVRR